MFFPTPLAQRPIRTDKGAMGYFEPPRFSKVLKKLEIEQDGAFLEKRGGSAVAGARSLQMLLRV